MMNLVLVLSLCYLLEDINLTDFTSRKSRTLYCHHYIIVSIVSMYTLQQCMKL